MSFDSWLRFLFWALAVWLLARALRAFVTGRAPVQDGAVLAAEDPGGFRFELALAFLTPALIAALLLATAHAPRDVEHTPALVYSVMLVEPLVRALRSGCWDPWFAEPVDRRERPVRYWFGIALCAALIALVPLYVLLR